MPSKGLIARIHILKSEAGLDDDQYRVLLGSYGVASSTEFSNDDAKRFCKRLEGIITPGVQGRRNAGWGKTKYEHLRGRRGDYAEPQQLRMIEAIWRDVARDPSDQALSSFLRRQSGVKNIVWLKKTHVESILTALKQMKKDQSKSINSTENGG